MHSSYSGLCPRSQAWTSLQALGAVTARHLIVIASICHDDQVQPLCCQGISSYGGVHGAPRKLRSLRISAIRPTMRVYILFRTLRNDDCAPLPAPVQCQITYALTARSSRCSFALLAAPVPSLSTLPAAGDEAGHVKSIPHDGLSLVPHISNGSASLYLCAQLCQKNTAETNTGSQLHTSCTNKSVPRLLCCAVSDRRGDRSPEMQCWHGNRCCLVVYTTAGCLYTVEISHPHMSCLHLLVRT